MENVEQTNTVIKSEAMCLVDFYPQTFAEIPKQDNPALNDDECLMITKAYGNDKAVVLNIIPDPIETVNHVAEFWDHDVAVAFCEEYLIGMCKFERGALMGPAA